MIKINAPIIGLYIFPPSPGLLSVNSDQISLIWDMLSVKHVSVFIDLIDNLSA